MTSPFGPARGAPYKRLALTYLQLGWSPIPLPAREKSPVPDHPSSFTGAPGVYVTEAHVRAWCRPSGRAKAGNFIYPPGNIALRLPPGVIGIDVDAYEGKTGAATLGRAEAEWGKLPPTWVACNKMGSPISGIRLFRIPEGLNWPGELPFGKGVELIRWDHRYVIVAPSIHDKTGDEYFWRTPEGDIVWLSDADSEDREVADRGLAVGAEIELPAPDADSLPELPAAWVEGLTSGEAFRGGKAMAGVDGGELPEREVRAWVKARGLRGEGDDMCSELRRTLGRAQRQVRKASDDGGAHDAARDGAWALIGDAQAGHLGLGVALGALRRTFMEAIKGRRTDRVARSEWKRIVIRGVSKVAAEGGPAEVDPCAGLSGAGGTGGRTRRRRKAGEARAGLDEGVGRAAAGSTAFDYVRDDGGNAQRLQRRLDGGAVWALGQGIWYLFDSDTGLWRPDIDGLEIKREALSMVRDMAAEAEYIEDTKARGEFLKFVRSSGNAGKLEAAIRVASTLRGMAVGAHMFDANPRTLVCANGVLELGRESGAGAISFRPTSREDYATISTGVRYVEGAVSGDWDKFLDRFLPDPEVRTWAQKLAGYSLYGGNPSRVLAICKGPTSSGKTTFVNVLAAALGGYAGVFSLSLFRDNQDERSRPDIVAALPRRLIYTEETSGAWKLHADQIKRSTGSGVWSARVPFAKVYVERLPAFVPWIATNNPPTIEGADAALRKRIRAVPFLHQIPAADDDPFFGERLMRPEALEAILAWVVAGWGLYLDDETLTDMPDAAAKMALELMNEFSELDECLAEICDFEASASCESGALYAAYLLWHGENGEEKGRLSANAFGRALSNKGIERDTVWSPDAGKATKVRIGVRLREEWAKLAFGG